MTQEEKLKKIATKHNLLLTDKIESVLKAKNLLLKERWIYCPCESTNKSRYCGSKLCLSDIDKDNVCHCGLFKRKEK